MTNLYLVDYTLKPLKFLSHVILDTMVPVTLLAMLRGIGVGIHQVVIEVLKLKDYYTFWASVNVIQRLIILHPEGTSVISAFFSM